MGAHATQFLGPSLIQFSAITRHTTISESSRWWCLSGGGRCCSRRNRDEYLNRISNFCDRFEYDEEEVEFGFWKTPEKRTRWFDDFHVEDEEEFENSRILKFIFKVIGAFGWIIPAVIMSFIMGKRTDAMIISLALPIAQTSLSLVAEIIWGVPDDEAPRPKYKKKKRPFYQPAAPPRRKANSMVKSWADASDVSAKTEKVRSERFGGWDELD